MERQDASTATARRPGQPRLQYRTEQNWADGGITGVNVDAAFKLDFVVADNSLTDSLYNSNRVLAAETTMMMKEHIVDTYGEIKYTMSATAARAARSSQNTVSSVYPGLLDGIQPSCDFPDSITTGIEVSDCVLLVNALPVQAGNGQTLMTGEGLSQAAGQRQEDRHQRPPRSRLACHGWYTTRSAPTTIPGNYTVPMARRSTTTPVRDRADRRQ